MSSLSTAQSRALALLPKITGWASFGFSAVVAITILRDKHRRSLCYHRLICGICMVDMSSSLWLGLSTWPIPAGSGPLWAVGNDTTCTVQGFFTQFGVSSSFYNTSLSIYFWLVIVKGFREEQLQKIEPLLHAVPLLWALVSSITGLVLNVYASANLWCWVSADEEAFRWAAFYGPLWCMICLVTAICIAIFWHVRRLEMAAQKYRLFQRNNNGNNHQYAIELQRSQPQSSPPHERKPTSSVVPPTSQQDEDVTSTATPPPPPQTMTSVSSSRVRSMGFTRQSTRSMVRRSKRVKDIARQCFLYAFSFYINWAALTATRLIQTLHDGRVYYPLVLIAAMCVPLQGLPNFVVYVMPKLRQARRRDPRAGWYNLVVRSLARDSVVKSSVLRGNRHDRQQHERGHSNSGVGVANPSGINDDDDDDESDEYNDVYAEFCADVDEGEEEIEGGNDEAKLPAAGEGNTKEGPEQ